MPLQASQHIPIIALVCLVSLWDAVLSCSSVYLAGAVLPEISVPLPTHTLPERNGAGVSATVIAPSLYAQHRTAQFCLVTCELFTPSLSVSVSVSISVLFLDLLSYTWAEACKPSRCTKGSSLKSAQLTVQGNMSFAV